MEGRQLQHGNRVFRIPSAQTSLGRLSMAGTIYNSAGVQKPRVFGQRAVVLVTGGSGRYRDQQGIFQEILPGSLVHVFADLPHMYGNTEGGRWDECHVCFSGPVFDCLESAGVFDRRRPVWHLKPVDYWVRRLTGMLELWAGGVEPLSALQAVGQWIEFITEAHEASIDGAGTGSWAGKASELLGRETRLPLSVSPEEIAGMCGLGYESFRKKFREVFGCGPVEYHRARVMERAEAMLAKGDLTNAQIAEMLGFCDEFHFSKLFKRYAGKTPGEVRRSAAGDQ